MSDFNPRRFASALEDFHRARTQAVMKEILARLTGQPLTLMSYEEVRQALRVQNSKERGIAEIPLNAIIGSVNRYTDFTRDFLPLGGVVAQRWAQVEAAADEPAGWPPIEVYKIGDAYFVKDGNHRVSVARQLGAKTIQAYVTEVETSVPLAADIRPDDLILKAEYAEFLDHTHLNTIRPDADLSVSVPGQYAILEEHIGVHRYFMGLDFKRDISDEEAVAHWYDTVFLPVVEVIRRQGVLRDFPGRTETDLYIWIAEHRVALEEELGYHVQAEDAASDLVAREGKRRGGSVSRLGSKLANALLPAALGSGPAAGQWRLERLNYRQRDRLFSDILVAINGTPEGWRALEIAVQVAWLERSENGEKARLHGLHIVADEANLGAPGAQAIQARFDQDCIEKGIDGHLAVVSGDVPHALSSRAHWNDLVVVSLAYPPSAQPLAAIMSGFRVMLQLSPRPVLAIPNRPGSVPALTRALLAYDGSPKAQEALFLTAYIGGQWNLSIGVVSVEENGGVGQETLDTARRYMETHQVNADYHLRRGQAPGEILACASEGKYDLLLIGSYGRHPLLEAVLGSGVDQVLRESTLPMLICK